MKTTILGGVLFLAPLAVLAIILSKAFQISLVVAKPISQVVALEGPMQVIAANVVAFVLILVFCFVAGLLARRAFLSKTMQRLEGILIDLIPAYAIFRGIVSSASSDVLQEQMKPVLVRFDDYEQIAFEIEQRGDHFVLFLPGSPSAWSGSTVVVAADRVTRLDLRTHQAIKLLRVFGRGTLDVRAQAAQDTQAEPGATG